MFSFIKLSEKKIDKIQSKNEKKAYFDYLSVTSCQVCYRKAMNLRLNSVIYYD